MTCDARQMFVTFTHQHIFKALDKTKIDSADAAALIGEIYFQKTAIIDFFAKIFFVKIRLFFITIFAFFEICLSNFEYYNE